MATKKEIKATEQMEAFKHLQEYKGLKVYAEVNSVSRSGMSRRIEYYVIPEKNHLARIGYYIAKVIDYSYSIDKGGISVSGCGMDMIFHVLSSFNYKAATLETGKTLKELLDSGTYGLIYDDYFFDANSYGNI